MPVEKLSHRALNRATLERQMLLARRAISPVDAVDHLVGVQAQLPMNPYVGLWSRIEAFDPTTLGARIGDRTLVRIPLMRSTIHLVSAEDCLRLRPLMQPVLDKELARHPEFGPALEGVDLEPVLAFARTVVAGNPMNGSELRAAMAERFPDLDPAALAYACRNHLAFVQVPPRGVWGRTAQVRSTTAESFLGRDLDPNPSIEDVVRRFLGAYGPAAVADVAAWSRLTGMREVVERLRPGLRTFHDVDGKELFDLPYLSDRGVRICLQGHQPFSAGVQAVYQTLKALREGTPPEKLEGVASEELMKRVTRGDDYARWMKDFL